MTSFNNASNAVTRITIAEGIRAEMLDTGDVRAWRGIPDLLLSGVGRATTGRGGNEHPRARIERAMSAMRESKLFRRAGHIRASDFRGTREILHPVYVLRERDATGENALSRVTTTNPPRY